MTTALRTPEERFVGLADYPFAPHYFEADSMRMHYLDEGAGPVVVLLHGEPTWSYLYRRFIPPLVAAGYRCVVPDYIGFGKSDKVAEDDWYTAERHIGWLQRLLDHLGLHDITLLVHDWGGPIGLRQVADDPGNFRLLFVLNTWLHHDGYDYTDGIRRWRSFATTRFEPGTGDLPAGFIVSSQLRVDEERKAAVAAAYEAPFPDASFKAGIRRFPWMLPFAQPGEGNAVDQERCFRALAAWTKPIHFIFGDRDDVFTLEWERSWAAQFAQATVDMVSGPHFPQEESPEAIVGLMLRYMSL